MTLELLFALIIFLAPHAVPSIPGLRPRLIEKFGRAGYLLGYITLSTITFIWLIVATLRAPYLGLWALSPWHVYVVLVLVALGCTLLIAGLATANPLSLSILTAGNDVPKNAVLRITRHPLLWALGLWGMSHVIVNGDVASIILFGILAVFSLGYMPLMDRRVQKTRGMEEWRRLSAGTSLMLFAAYFRPGSRPFIDRTLILSAVGGLGMFVLLLYLHGPILY